MKLRKLSWLLMAALLVFAIGCDSGDDDDDDDDTTGPSTTEPVLSLSVSSLSLGSELTFKTLTMENSGVDTLVWTAAVDEDWVSLSFEEGTLIEGEDPFELTVYGSRSGLDYGDYSATITFTYNVDETKTCRVTMNVPEPEEEVLATYNTFTLPGNQYMYTDPIELPATGLLGFSWNLASWVGDYSLEFIVLSETQFQNYASGESFDSPFHVLVNEAGEYEEFDTGTYVEGQTWICVIDNTSHGYSQPSDGIFDSATISDFEIKLIH